MSLHDERQTIYLFWEMHNGPLDKTIKINLSKLLKQYGQTVNKAYKEELEMLTTAHIRLKKELSTCRNKKK